MTVGKTDEIKQELARKAENAKAGTKLKKSMSIADMIKVMEHRNDLRGWHYLH